MSTFPSKNLQASIAMDSLNTIMPNTTNLSVIATAKKLNPEIMTIVRENEMEDYSIFESAKIDHIFIPSKILINKTANALINPLADKFLRIIIKKIPCGKTT